MSRVSIIAAIMAIWVFPWGTALAQEIAASPTTRGANSGEAGLQDESEPFAQLEDIDLLSLEVPMVITAGRREQRLSTTPYPISVITAEDIRWSGVRSVPDALRLVPGVDVAELSCNAYGVAARGGHGFLANQMLILVDGRQIFDSIYGGTIWGAWPFQLEDIERIEVIRGSSAMTWGANASQGVINIITKDPRDQQGLTLSGGGGSRGTAKGHAGYGYADEKLRLRLSSEYEGSDGYKGSKPFLWVVPGNADDDLKAGRFGLHAIYESGPKDKLTLSAGNALVDGGLPKSHLSGLGMAKNPSSQTNYLMGNWRHAIDKDSNYEVTGYFNDYTGAYGVKQGDYRYQQFAMLFRHTFKPAEDHTLSWGLDNRIDIVDTTNADPFMLTERFVSSGISAVYIQDDWNFAPRWNLGLAGRAEYDYYGGWQPAGRISLSREVREKGLLYGVISRGFSMAPGAARFLAVPMVNGLFRVTSDRYFDAPWTMGYELGYRDEWFKSLNTDVVLFWQEGYDQMCTSMLDGPPGLKQFNYDNRARTSRYGVEAEARYKVNEQLTLLGHYTFMLMDWRARVPFEDTMCMYPPTHKFMLGARYSPTEDLHLSTHFYYYNATISPNANFPLVYRHVPTYCRVDARAEHEFWNDRASVAVGVRNFQDSSHFEGASTFLNDTEVPRIVYAELRMVFK